MPDKTLVTVSAGGVVLNGKEEVLIVSQRGISWSLPKGHLEKGEDPLAAAHREIMEETGVQDIVFVTRLGEYQRLKEESRFGCPELKTIIMFLFFSREDQLAPRDLDNPEARWVPISEVAAMLSYAEDQEFFLSIRDRIARPRP